MGRRRRRPAPGDGPAALEVKEPDVVHSLKKNANAVIFDLVFGAGGRLLLVECKDSRSKIGSDVEKLRTVCADRSWRASLATALRSGPFLKRFDCDLEGVESGEALTPCVAHPGGFRTDLAEVVQFRVAADGAVDVHVGPDVDDAVRKRL